MVMKHPVLLTVGEAAESLSISVKTIYAWIGQRRIDSVRVGGTAIRIPASEVARIVEEGTMPRLRAA